RIAADEHAHAALLRQLQMHLPTPAVDRCFDLATERFFLGLASPDAGLHFTRIAALDSAVCLLLMTLRRAQPQLFVPALRRILADEARHVNVTSGYAHRLATRLRRSNAAAEVRAGMASLLEQRA